MNWTTSSSNQAISNTVSVSATFSSHRNICKKKKQNKTQKENNSNHIAFHGHLLCKLASIYLARSHSLWCAGKNLRHLWKILLAHEFWFPDTSTDRDIEWRIKTEIVLRVNGNLFRWANIDAHKKHHLEHQHFIVCTCEFCCFGFIVQSRPIQ